MGYSSLLEMNSEDTFANIATLSESLTSFVYENTNFEFCLSIEEAVMLEAGEDSTNKVEKVSAGVKKTALNIWEKIKDFCKKFVDFCKKVFQKIAIGIESMGNKIMKAIYNDSTAVIGKDIELKALKNKDVVKKVFQESIKSLEKFDKGINKFSTADSVEDMEEIYIETIDNTVVQLKELFKTSFGEDSSDIDKVEIKAASVTSVKKAYDANVAAYFKSLGENYKKLDSVAAKISKELLKMEKPLKKDKNSAKELKFMNDVSAGCMQISNGSVKFAFDVLTLATKNSTKIALAAVSKETGKALAKELKAKEEEEK